MSSVSNWGDKASRGQILDRPGCLKTRYWWGQYCMYVYSAHIFHKWDFMFINQRGTQDEATGVRVSAVFAVCATLCRQPCTYTHMYCVCMHTCAY